MATKQQQTLSYSVYDRLLGAEYDNVTIAAGDSEPNQAFTHRIIATIARDLQNLLNTRKMEMSLEDRYHHLEPSIVDYGVIDLTAVNARSDKEREKYRESVQCAIENYEPRLKNVKVNVIDNPNESSLIFHFNISAVLMVEPTPLSLQFDSVLPTDTRMFQVRGMEQ
jgi:type VI secretion system protein ImpF